MKNFTLSFFLLFFCIFSYGQSTINITTSGGSYASEKWVNITTEPNGAGTQIWGQGDGTQCNGNGLINQDISISAGTYYVNCYDNYDDGWDGTLISVTAYGVVIGDNGGVSPNDGSDTDASYLCEGTTEELETSFSIIVPDPPASAPDCATNFVNNGDPSCGNEDFTVSWDTVLGAAGYLITAGTTSGGNDLADAVDQSGTSYNFTAVPGQSYYYTVTPYNANGNAEGCVEQSLSLSTAICTPCDSATVLTPGTQQSGDTADFGDLFDDSVCLGYYDGGDDAIYSYLATEDGETMTVTVDFTATYGGVSMSLGCPSGDSTAYTCVGSVTGSGSGVKSFTSDALVAGETYYIHISTWASPQTTAYTLDTVVTPAPSCLAPTSLTATSINTTGAIINWVSDGTGFMIEIQPGGVAQGNPGTGYVIGDVTNYPATTLDLTGINPDTGVGYLAPNTQYSIYVVNVCADGNSEYVGPATFTTLALPIVPDYTNDFSEFPGDLWSAGSPTGSFSSAWLADGFANDGTTGAAKTNIYSSNNTQVLESPIFDLTGGNYSLNLKAAVTAWNTTDALAMGSDDSVTVSVSVDGGDYVVLHTWNESNNPGPTGTDMPTVDLSSYSSANVKFAITMSDGTVNDLEDYDFFIDNFSITAPTSALSLQGIIDFSTPGTWLKGIHLVASEDIADLSAYGIGVATNGGGTDGEELELTGSASAGDHILVARSGGATATIADVYMNASNVFDQVLIYNNASQGLGHNGDDAIELFFNDAVVETFGEIDVDGTGEAWEYTDSWAYKGADGTWTNAAVNCTDGSFMMWDSGCVYPFVVDQQCTGASTDLVTAYSHDFEAIGPGGYWWVNGEVGTERVDDPITADGSGGNPYNGVMQYTDDLSSYSNLQMRFCSKLDLASVNTVSLRAMIDGASLTGSQPNQLALKLQDATEAQPWANQNVVTQAISVTDQWVNLTFEFNDDASMVRDDIDNIVFQFNGEGNNDAVVAYIDDIVFSYTEPVATEYTDVTFNVDTALITGGVGANGIYLGGGVFGNATAHPMTDTDGDGIYTVTVTIEEGTAGNYIFLNSPNWDQDWGAKENLNGQSCADAGNFDDRILSAVGADDYTLNHCFGNCDTDPTTGFCIIPENDYEVTFNVDTNNVIVGDRGMYLGDGIFGGSDAVAMSDDDGDGIWTVTVTLSEGTTGNYAFFKNPGDGGDWGTKENLEGLSCADTANYNNRILDPVTADTTINYCFATCDASCGTVVRHDVTFNVDTADITVGETGMFLGGGIMGGANAFAMSDTDGDGVYSVTVSVPEGTSGNYVFLNGSTAHWNYDGKEDLTGQACADGQYNDRLLDAVTGPTTISYCFATCEVSCTTAGLDDLGMSQFTYYPNPVNDQLTIRAQSNVKDITVFNMLGQVVSSQSPNAKDCLVDMAAMQSGAYFVQISIGSTVEMVRVLKQ